MNPQLLSRIFFIAILFGTPLLSQDMREDNFIGNSCYGSTGGFILSTSDIMSVGNVSVNGAYQNYFHPKNIENGFYKAITFGAAQNAEVYLSFLSLSKKVFDENNTILGIKYAIMENENKIGFTASTDIRLYQIETTDLANTSVNGYCILPSLVFGSQSIEDYYFYGVIGHKTPLKMQKLSIENIFLGFGATFSISEKILLLAEVTSNDYSLNSSGSKSSIGMKWNIFDHVQLAVGTQWLYEHSSLSSGLFLSFSFSTSVFSPMKTLTEPEGKYFIPPPIPELGMSNDSDTDDDGLTDDEEKSKYGTDSKVADTDNDGLIDGLEVFRYKTDPLVQDTDKDGLSDGDEVLKYHTNPLCADTDSGSVSDGEEILFEFDPLNKNDDDMIFNYPLMKNSILGSIQFKNGAAESSGLKKLTIAMKRYTKMLVDIIIYDSEMQKNDDNEKLQTVRNYLFREQIDSNRFTIKIVGREYIPQKEITSTTSRDAILGIFRRQ